MNALSKKLYKKIVRYQFADEWKLKEILLNK